MNNETNLIHWIWSKGKQYEKSLKGKDKQSNQENSIQSFDNRNINETVILEEQNQKNDLNELPQGFIQKEKKLNGQNEKLSSRHMMIQKNINPFLERNYLQDLNTEDEFLRPRNSNS